MKLFLVVDTQTWPWPEQSQADLDGPEFPLVLDDAREAQEIEEKNRHAAYLTMPELRRFNAVAEGMTFDGAVSYARRLESDRDFDPASNQS